ncbi:MAG TPA: ATP-binding protein [Kofleriaceae bacterium]|nr:ATP-binding protein [Kofleriaceae bacterium]
MSRALTYAKSIDEVFQLTADRAAELLAAEMSLLMIVDGDGLLALRASHGVDPSVAATIHEPLSELLIPHLERVLEAKGKSFLAVPLVVANTIAGILVVVRTAATTPPAEGEWLLSALADQAALALEKNQVDEIAVFREQLIAIVGHDLRNPLGAVLMAGELLLQREGLGESETALARKITKGVGVAMRLIDQLLDLTRSRLGGGIALDRQAFDINDVCRQVTMETELSHPDRSLQVDVHGDMLGVWDRDRVYQLLSNLVGNAVHHGAPRTPITVRMVGGATDIEIEVANLGTPIPAAAVPFIFDAFRRGREDHPSRTGGLGLGLYIAQQIARSHGGAIAVTSSDGDGTRFRVRLPRLSA